MIPVPIPKQQQPNGTPGKKPPTPRPPTSWNIYKVAKKATWLGTVEAPDSAAAIEKAAAEFKLHTRRLLAVARR